MSALRDLFGKIWRLLAGMSDASPTFPVRIPEYCLVDSLAKHDASKLKKFDLIEAHLSRTDGGVHWRITLHFRYHSASYYLVADRTQPQRAEPPTATPSLSQQSSDTSLALLDASREKGGLDGVRGFLPGPGKDWWKGAAPNDVSITKLEVMPSSRACLTLLDVAIILRSVSLHRPNYDLAKGNCWWFARCSGLLLESLAAGSQTSEVVGARESDFLRRAPIPYSAPPMISDDRVRQDAREIRVLFDKLMAEKALEEQNQQDELVRRIQEAESRERVWQERAQAAEEGQRAAQQELLEMKRRCQAAPVTSY